MREEYDPVPPFAATPVDSPVVCGHVLTIDEIVGRLVGYELQEMPYYEVLDAAIEQAGFALQEAELAEASTERLEALQARINHLGQRRRDAIRFDRELSEIAEGRPDEHLILSKKEYPDGLPRFITTSVYDWSKEVLGKEIPEWAPISGSGELAGRSSTPDNRTEIDESPPRRDNLLDWGGATLDFRAHRKLCMTSGNGRSKTVDLEDIDLINRRNNELNAAGSALLGLATRNSIPKKVSSSGPGISPKIMSELRNSLRTLVPDDADPFYDYNPADGWKPRFCVRDRRGAADERARERAQQSSYQEDLHGASNPDEYTFESEDHNDPAAKFLAENDR